MIKTFMLIFATLLLVNFNASAFELQEPLSILGNEIENIFESEILPSAIYPNRGIESDEDNVVFYYSNGFYLFLFDNRVWQIRFDQTFKEEILKIKMGILRSEILSEKLDAGLIPISTGEDFVTFEIIDSPYPVRMKLYFTDDKLDDLYIYRADF